MINPKHRWLFNIILIHVARTWERIRVVQPHGEMPQDNIESSEEAIPTIADQIFNDDVIQAFLNAPLEVQCDNYWQMNTEEGFSDSYIEALAEKKIKLEYL